MNKNDPFAQIFPDTPRFETPSSFVFDSDADGVIDPWDCEPFNPDADGVFGDAWKRVASRVRQATRVDYGRAAARRAAVRRAVTHRVAPVTRWVRAAVARAPVHVSRERAAERRADVRRAVARRVAPAAAVVRAAVARAPIHPSPERAVARRAAVVSGISAFDAKIPTLYDISAAGAPFREKHKAKIDVVRGAYETYSPKFAKEVVYPFAGGYAVGQYEELQKHPAKFVATTAVFAVLPFALKGVGKVATGVGAAKAVGKVPVVGKPLVTYGPKAALTGIGALWAGSVGYRIHEAPTIEAKGRVAGKIMASEALPLAVAAGFPAMAAVTPTIVRAPGYRGIGIKGAKKPVTEIREVPAITRGGVIEAELLKKPPTAPKEIITGFIRQPKPLIGIRTAEVTAPEGVTTTWKGVQVGKGWTPAEIMKTYKVESVTGAEGTALAMEKLTQARLGQFRYEHTGFARGKIDPGYFLPEAKVVSKGLPELMTAEKGLVPTGRMLPSVDVIKPPLPPKPTRLYAEISQPYMKAVDAPLAGSPAHMRWVEAGFRKVSYGVKGAPGVKQPRIEITAEPWGYHPTFPPGIAAGEAVAPSYLSPTPPVRQIPTGMYFHPEGAPSSRVLTIESLLRPKTTGIRPPTEPIAVKPTTIRPEFRPTAKPEPMAVEPKPIIEPVRAPEPMRVLAPEPAAPAGLGVMVAEPVTSPVLEAMLGDMKAAEVLQTGASCPIFAPTGVPSRPTVPTGVTAPAKEGWWAPEARPVPGAVPARQRTISEMLARTRKPAPEPRRRPFAVPGLEGTRPIGFETPAPAPITEFITEPVVKAEERRRPVPLLHPDTAAMVSPPPTTVPEPIPDYVPPPVSIKEDSYIPPPPPPPPPVVTTTPPPPPPPPPVVTPKYPFGDSASAAAAAPRRRRPHEWFVEHEMMTLEGFLGGAPKPATGVFPEPDLGSHVAAKAAGGRARRPGLLDVPEGW